mgnify:CR=1 FL=1
MHVLNIGSLNIDNVYQVPHFLRGGETVAAYRRTLHVGGKGLNQSVALARAGIASSHAGIIGRDGEVLKNFLEAEGVMLRMLKCVPMKLQVIRSSRFLPKARMPFFITRAPTPASRVSS